MSEWGYEVEENGMEAPPMAGWLDVRVFIATQHVEARSGAWDRQRLTRSEQERGTGSMEGAGYAAMVLRWHETGAQTEGGTVGILVWSRRASRRVGS